MRTTSFGKGNIFLKKKRRVFSRRVFLSRYVNLASLVVTGTWPLVALCVLNARIYLAISRRWRGPMWRSAVAARSTVRVATAAAAAKDVGGGEGGVRTAAK